MTSPIGWMERHQIALYLTAMTAGAVAGLLLPPARNLSVAINPVLALLLYATFLGVPFASIAQALRDRRFLAAVLAVNFVVVPPVAYALSRFVADDPVLLFGVLLVLLTPCIDYVIVFTALAGGAHERLLAAAPLLMLAQVLLLPVYLLLFIGPSGVAAVEVAPFAQAFVLLIVLPLAGAAATQALARDRGAVRALGSSMIAAVVPLMMATLFVVIASQAGDVAAQGSRLVVLVPIYTGFALMMAALGVGAGKVFGLDVASRRALVFSGATRNSLVVLPLALALPAPLALAPAVVVTQTLVELIAMVIYVRVVPALIPSPRAQPTSS